MGMSREDSAFPLGSLVLVKRGHHAGSVFAVVGIERGAGKNGRILIAGGRVSTRKPKRKNPRHIVKTGIVSYEIAARLAGGKCIDDGWLVEILNRQKKGVSRLILEEVGRSECRKKTP